MSSNRKKIVIVGPAYPFRGGIANFTDSLYEELIKEHNVKVISFKRQYPSFLFPGKSQYESDYLKEKIYALPVIDSLNPLTWYSATKEIISFDPDLVIFAFWLPFFGPCYGKIAGILKKKNIRVAALCHNVLPHEKRPGDRNFASYFFKSVDHFILLSSGVVNDLLSFNENADYVVLPHPVYSRFGKPVSKSEGKEFLNLTDEKVLLFFGLIREYKGLDTLLKAVAQTKVPGIRLVVAGEFYSDKSKYYNMISELGIEDSVSFYSEFIPANEVKYYFSAADAVVLPYKDATQSGIVQIAINFNIPMIVTNTGGLGEVVRNAETGYVVDKNNPAELAAAITKFYEKNNEETFRKNLAGEAEKYSWSAFVKGIIKLTGI